MRQPIIVLGYAVLAAALLAAALLTDSQAIDLMGFLGFLVASAAFAYVFLLKTIWHCPICFSDNSPDDSVCSQCGISRFMIDWPDTAEGTGADDPRAVFVFSDDPSPTVFASLVDAAGHMEAIDVNNGEYHSLYALDGRVIRANTLGDRVILTVTAEHDVAGLRGRIKEYADRGQLSCNPDDLVETANELLQEHWESRWPKRPEWVARRLHGEGPVEI